uniref:Doublecortin domain-containing protein n=1 Tax=Syphacia muris TaxID=451379 RepID=A0A158R5F9_9BILA
MDEEQSAGSSTSTQIPPNLPEPVNGGIKVYKKPNQDYTDPYTAKTVFFYREGDVYYTGFRVPVSKARYRTIGSLLDDLSHSISMPFGVRRVTTPYGKTTIDSIDQLEHLGRYIVSSTKTVRPLNFSLINKIDKNRKERATHSNRSNATSSLWVVTSPRYKSKLRSNRSNGTSYLPQTAKQMLFVLNGKPSRTYRAVLNPARNKSFDALLEEVSEGLNVAIFKIYAYSGKRLNNLDELMSLDDTRVLAVPRNERPKFHSNATFRNHKALPSVSMSKPSDSTNSSSALVNDSNHYANEFKKQSYKTYAASPDTDMSTEKKYSKKRKIIRKRPKLIPKLIRKTSSNKKRRQEEDYYRFSDESVGKIVENDATDEKQFNATEANLLLDRDSPYLLTNAEVAAEDDVAVNEDEDAASSEAAYSVNLELETSLQPKEDELVIDCKESEPEARQNSEDDNDADDSSEAAERLDDEDMENQWREAAAIKVQSVWRGYNVRKRLKEAKNMELTEDENETSSLLTVESEQNQFYPKSRQNSLAFDSSSLQIDQINSSSQLTTYTVSVLTGNRWAAEMDKNLYVELCGEHATSGRHTLRQDTKEEKFRRNHIDSFLIETVNLGTLTKLIIGHENYGYGAGVFIEQVLVTENIAEGRQFLFQCNKWLDSGQVDGKISRLLKTTAFYYISSIPRDNITTKGRWELIVHSGKKDGTGGTTSNLNIIGYGKEDVSASNKIYDSKLASVPSTSLIQVDFGDIGDLLKIRIEIDGNGDSPDYFLDKVELRDMDTEERMVSFVGKWLRWGTSDAYQQPYREFPVFRAAFEPLNARLLGLRRYSAQFLVMTYEGKLRLSDKNKINLTAEEGFLQIFGEFGSTGRFPLKLFPQSQKMEIPFKTEAVSVGLIRFIRLYVKTDEIGHSISGEEIYEGLCKLQSIYDNTLKLDINTGSNWILNDVMIRESQHTPYRFILRNSRVRTQGEDSDEVFKEVVFTGGAGFCSAIRNHFLLYLILGMEGLATKVRKKKNGKRTVSQWRLEMRLTNSSDLLPKVTLCSQDTATEMALVERKQSETDLYCFEQRQTNSSLLLKVRVSIDTSQQPSSDSNADSEAKKRILAISKMMLYDKKNGDELRFPELDAILTSESVYEFPAIWPDISPLAGVQYQPLSETDLSLVLHFCISAVTFLVTVKTEKSSGSFDVYINLIGTKGDIGFRKLVNDDEALFSANTVGAFC